MSQPLAPWVPNPADIEDGQFLQWDAATGRFIAVDAPEGGADMQVINAINLPFVMPFTDPLPTDNNGTLTVTTQDSDQLVFQCQAEVENTDGAENRDVSYFLMVFDEVEELWVVIQAFTPITVLSTSVRVFTVYRSTTIEIGGTNTYAIGWQASGAGPRVIMQTFGITTIPAES